MTLKKMTACEWNRTQEDGGRRGDKSIIAAIPQYMLLYNKIWCREKSVLFVIQSLMNTKK